MLSPIRLSSSLWHNLRCQWSIYSLPKTGFKVMCKQPVLSPKSLVHSYNFQIRAAIQTWSKSMK